MGSNTEREKVLPSHSMTERHFYLMVLQCEKCGTGPFDKVSSERSGDDAVDIWYVRCRSCGRGCRLLFDRSTLAVCDEPENRSHDQIPVVNPTDETSRLLDVGQWLALFYVIISAASEAGLRQEAQRLGYEATLCLEEALKFYPVDSELPGEDAFFTESSRRRFKEHPEQFTRQRLYQMREKLPSLRVMRSNFAPGNTSSRDCETRSGWFSRVLGWLKGVFRR